MLVNSILLRSQTNATTGETAPLLTSTSPIRKQAEQCRLDIIRWLRKRWLNVRTVNGFEPLEDWALKEISDGTAFWLISSVHALKPVPFNRA